MNEYTAGSTSIVETILLQDSTVATGAGKTSLAFNTAGLTCYYKRSNGTASVAVTLVTISTLGTFTSGGFKEIDTTNQPGLYEFHPPNAAFASGAKHVTFYFTGATGLAQRPIKFRILAVDPDDAVRNGMTALPPFPIGTAGALPVWSSTGGPGSMKMDTGGGLYITSIGAGTITLTALASALKQVILPGYISIGGSTTPSISGDWWQDAISSDQPTYTNGTYFLWANGSGFTISTSVGSNGTAYWTGGTATSIEGTYTNHGTATGTPVVTFVGNASLCVNQFDRPFPPHFEDSWIQAGGEVFANVKSIDDGSTDDLLAMIAAYTNSTFDVRNILGTVPDSTGTGTLLSRLTAARAGYLDNLNGLVQAIWDKATSSLTTAGSIGKLLVDNINATISSRSTLTAAGVWDYLTNAATTAGSMGKRIVDYLTGDIFARLGAPAGASTAADIAAAKAVADAVKAKTDNLPALPATEGSASAAAASAATAATQATAANLAASALPSANTIAVAVRDVNNASPAMNSLGAKVNTAASSSSGGTVGAGADRCTMNITVASTPIAEADVWISTDSAGSNVVAGTLQTNSAGDVTFLLDAGVAYYLWMQKDGVNPILGEAFTAAAD